MIMEYLEERYPEPALWPADPAERALGRLWLERFDDRLGAPTTRLRRDDEGARAELDERLAELDAALEGQPYLSGREYGLADIGYVPWVLRAQERLERRAGRFPALADWAASGSARGRRSRRSASSSRRCDGRPTCTLSARRADVGAARSRARHESSRRALPAAARRSTTGRSGSLPR